MANDRKQKAPGSPTDYVGSAPGRGDSAHGAEMTTRQVAGYLNVSRTYVLRLIDSGRLPARMVGTRRRIAFQDLVRFDEADRERRRAALQELAQIDQELGI